MTRTKKDSLIDARFSAMNNLQGFANGNTKSILKQKKSLHDGSIETDTLFKISRNGDYVTEDTNTLDSLPDTWWAITWAYKSGWQDGLQYIAAGRYVQAGAPGTGTTAKNRIDADVALGKPAVMRFDAALFNNAMYNNEDDVIDESYFSTYPGRNQTAWWDNGIKERYEFTDAKMATYYNIGGQLDYVIMDDEKKVGVFNDGLPLTAVENDSRFPALMEEFGCDINSDDWKNTQVGTEDSYRFNAGMARKKHEALHEAFVKPIRKYFPDCIVTNFDNIINPSDVTQMAWQTNLRQQPSWAVVGHYQAVRCYPTITSNIQNWKPNGTDAYGGSDLSIIRWWVNRCKIAYRNAQHFRLAPWITDDTSGVVDLANTAYNHELIRQIALCGTSGFRYFNDNADENDDTQTNDLLTELNGKGGPDTMVPINLDPLDWYGEFITNGVVQSSLNRSLWRVTVAEATDSITIEGDPFDTSTVKGAWYEGDENLNSITVVDTT